MEVLDEDSTMNWLSTLMGKGNDDHQERDERECLSESISALAQVLLETLEHRKHEFEWHRSHHNLATKQDLERLECRIMSVISDFVTKQKAFNDRQSKAIDDSVAAIGGLVNDVKGLNDKITELQNSPGGVTPEDQGLINELEVAGDALATKAEAAATALKALDDQTPPVVPPAPPV